MSVPRSSTSIYTYIQNSFPVAQKKKKIRRVSTSKTNRVNPFAVFYILPRLKHSHTLYVLSTQTVFVCFVWIWEQIVIISLGKVQWYFRHVRKTVKSDYCLQHNLSARTEQLGSHWTDFHEIWHLSILRKSVYKILVPLKSDTNSGYFTWRAKYIYDSYNKTN